jgi:hypothetical protein
MSSRNDDILSPNRRRKFSKLGLGLAGLILLGLFSVIGLVMVYMSFYVYVPAKYIAVMTKKTGKNLTNDQ